MNEIFSEFTGFLHRHPKLERRCELSTDHAIVDIEDWQKARTMIEDWQKARTMADLIEKNRPTIVCLCGSTRFSEAFRKANLVETLEGKIVLSIGCDFKSDDALGLPEDAKAMLDELHKRKIDLADEVLILNVGGYIGSSTMSELEYAREHNKRIRYLEQLER